MKISSTRPDCFSVLARILPFPDFRLIFTTFRYSPGFYHFHLHTLIQPFSGTRPDSFSVLARILPFPGFRTEFYVFSVFARILPFSLTHTSLVLCIEVVFVALGVATFGEIVFPYAK